MTTRIGLVSDTHMPRFGHEIPAALREGLTDAGVDLIIHLGDWTGAEIPLLFEAIAPLEGVAGNNDGPELVARWGRGRVIEVDGLRLGLTHGDLGIGRTTPERARSTFARDEVDAILFGHSHQPLIQRSSNGRWLINPGSPTDKRREPRYSWALLEIVAGEISPELRYFAREG
ncbi:MAG: metallophosphoesterase family protein [Chloroflexota bacterium]